MVKGGCCLWAEGSGPRVLIHTVPGCVGPVIGRCPLCFELLVLFGFVCSHVPIRDSGCISSQPAAAVSTRCGQEMHIFPVLVLGGALCLWLLTAHTLTLC